MTQTGELIQGSSNPQQLPGVLGSVTDGDGGCPQELLPAIVLILSTYGMWPQHLGAKFCQAKAQNKAKVKE